MSSVAEVSQDALELRALSPTLGVEVQGVDLAEPMTDAVFDRIYDAFLAPSAPAVPGPALRARRPGDLRAPLRLGPGAL